MIRSVPKPLFSPERSEIFNKLRLNTDIAGMILIRLLTPYTMAFPHWILIVISIYNIMASITILTLDPTRFPEACTTRIKQKQSWIYVVLRLPILIAALGIMVWFFPLPLLKLAPLSFGLLFYCYTDELLFRNILQPKLRKIGLSKFGSIGMQSSIYALAFYISGLSLVLVMIAFILGLFNGWIVYKYRSLWPAFVVSFIVHFLLLGG
jgi:membrane protease YdiL (CAAX protease family)